MSEVKEVSVFLSSKLGMVIWVKLSVLKIFYPGLHLIQGIITRIYCEDR